MKLVGLDVSTQAIGWAVLQFGERGQPSLVDSGLSPGFSWEGEDIDCPITVLGEADAWLPRTVALCYGMTTQIVCRPEMRVDYVAFEMPASKLNFDTVWKLAWAESMACWAWVQSLGLEGVGFISVPVPVAKSAVSGNPRAGKPTVVQCVNAMYGLELDPKSDHDVADAIAVATAAVSVVQQALLLKEAE